MGIATSSSSFSSSTADGAIGASTTGAIAGAITGAICDKVARHRGALLSAFLLASRSMTFFLASLRALESRCVLSTAAEPSSSCLSDTAAPASSLCAVHSRQSNCSDGNAVFAGGRCEPGIG